MAKPPAILFVCTGNSARSQMAEGFARHYGGNALRVNSAGTNPSGLNPNAIWAMNEVGVDISRQTSKSLADQNLAEYDYLITLCGDAQDSCPPLPPHLKHEHWPLADPAGIRGNLDNVIQGFRIIRYQVERRVRQLLARVQSGQEALELGPGAQ